MISSKTCDVLLAALSLPDASLSMSSIPFRTAFWALGLSFMLAVMLLIPNPKKIRMALHAQRTPVVLPHRIELAANESNPSDSNSDASSEETVTDKKAVTESAPLSVAAQRRRDRALRGSAASASRQEASAEKTATTSVAEVTTPAPVSPKRDSQPVRVASSDPTATLGYMPAPTTVLPLTTKSEAESSPTPMQAPVETKTTASTDSDSLSIPVPALTPNVAAKQVASLGEIPAVEMTPAPQPTPVPAKVTEVTPPPFPPTLNPPHAHADRISKSEPSPVVTALAELSEDESISITAASAPNRFHYRFEKSPIENVFKALGKQQGYTVILTNYSEGEYTGQMLDVDPAQAFAAIVKTHNYSVSRRGKLLLLSPRK